MGAYFDCAPGILVYYSWLKTIHRQYADGKPLLRPVGRFRADGHKGKAVELFDTKNKFVSLDIFMLVIKEL